MCSACIISHQVKAEVVHTLWSCWVVTIDLHIGSLTLKETSLTEGNYTWTSRLAKAAKATDGGCGLLGDRLVLNLTHRSVAEDHSRCSERWDLIPDRGPVLLVDWRYLRCQEVFNAKPGIHLWFAAHHTRWHPCGQCNGEGIGVLSARLRRAIWERIQDISIA